MILVFRKNDWKLILLVLFGVLSVEMVGASSENFIKAVVTVERFKGDKIKSIKDNYIPVVNNDNMGIKLFKAYFDSESKIWKKGKEICNQKITKMLCPVHPQQVIYAEAIKEAGSDIDCFSWFIDGAPVQVPFKGSCPFEDEKGCFEDSNPVNSDTFLFLNIEESKDVNISLLGRKCAESGAQTVRSGRKVFSDRISPVIINRSGSDSEAVNQTLSQDEKRGLSRSRNFLVEKKGDRVVFGVHLGPSETNEVGIFPYYLGSEWYFDVSRYVLINREEGLEMHWQLNGQRVDQVFISDTKEMYNIEINPDNGDISFDVNVDPGSDVSLDAVLRRIFIENEKETIVKSFGAVSIYDSSSKDKISVLVSRNEEMGLAGISGFFASTFKNAPDYLSVIFKISMSAIILQLFLIISSRVIKQNG